MALLTCWLQALAIVAWLILTTALVFTTTARITSERQTVCIPNFADRISCFDKNFVIPAQAGIYFDFASILRIQSKIKMDPSLRWDHDFDELRWMTRIPIWCRFNLCHVWRNAPFAKGREEPADKPLKTSIGATFWIADDSKGRP